MYHRKGDYGNIAPTLRYQDIFFVASEFSDLENPANNSEVERNSFTPRKRRKRSIETEVTVIPYLGYGIGIFFCHQ